MKKIDNFKSFFNKSTSDIPFLNLLYIMSIPLAELFIKLKFKPNTITTLSNISVLVSFYFILYEKSILMFLFFWIMALFLDICDGIVSRKTKQQSPHGSFYDHFTDQIKIVLLFFTVGLFYDTKVIWILAYISSAIFLLYSLLSYMVKFRIKILISHKKSENKESSSFQTSNKMLYLLKRYVYNNIFIIQGNFIIYLSFLFFDSLVIYVFYFLIFIILFNLIKSIKYMNSINNDLQKNNLKWS